MKQILEKSFQTDRAGDAVCNLGKFFVASFFQRGPTETLSRRPPRKSLISARRNPSRSKSARAGHGRERQGNSDAGRRHGGAGGGDSRSTPRRASATLECQCLLTRTTRSSP